VTKPMFCVAFLSSIGFPAFIPVMATNVTSRTGGHRIKPAIRRTVGIRDATLSRQVSSSGLPQQCSSVPLARPTALAPIGPVSQPYHNHGTYTIYHEMAKQRAQKACTAQKPFPEGFQRSVPGMRSGPEPHWRAWSVLWGGSVVLGGVWGTVTVTIKPYSEIPSRGRDGILTYQTVPMLSIISDSRRHGFRVSRFTGRGHRMSETIPRTGFLAYQTVPMSSIISDLQRHEFRGRESRSAHAREPKDIPN